MPDLADFISPLDGRVVHGRAGLREHNKRHNVTNPADFKETWAKQAKERERLYTPGAGYDKERRKEALIQSYERLSRK